MTFPSAGQTASQVVSMSTALAGCFVNSDSSRNHQIDAINTKPQLAEIWTVTVSGATNLKDYILTLTEDDGTATTVTYTSDASATIAEIAQGLSEAWNNEPLARRYGFASYTATTCVITGLLAGQTFTVSDADAQLSTAHTQTGAAAEAIPFARFVCHDGYTGALPKAKNAKSSHFSAQVATGDYTYNATSVLGVRITITATGQTYTAQVTQATSKDASTTALAGAINAILPTTTVAVTNAGGAGGADYEIVMTAELAGLEFSAEVFCSESATCLPSVTATTGPSEATSILRAALGVSLYDRGQMPSSISSSSVDYPANSVLMVADRGLLWVANSQSPGFGDAVYVEMDGTGANYGLLYNSSSATRLPLPLGWARWERYTGNYAAVSLNIQTA